MDAKRNVCSKSSEKSSRISVAISVTSLTLVTLLFMRIEFVYNNSKALETRLENRIQRIDDDLKTNIERIVKKRLQIYETASTARRKEKSDVVFGFESNVRSVSSVIRDHKRERRNVAAGTITLQQVRQEINNKLNQSCSVNNKICQTGPPGPPGALGYPGYKGEKGATGKTSSRGPPGPIGAPGVSGKRGPVGPQGVKGDKGDKGSVGAHGMRGETGTKGRQGQQGSIGLKGSKGSRGLVGIQGPKGECVVPLKISVYPVSQEVFVNEPVIFYCWVQGHLSSKITWRKLGGTLSNATVEDGALRVSSVQRSHAGSYMCTAHTSLGMFRILSRLHVKEPPKFTNRPPTVVNISLGSNVTLCCEASGSPRPNVEWFQAQKSAVSFPVFQEDGCLLIKMVKEDVDFICRAKNSFGLAETSTTVIAEILRGPPKFTNRPPTVVHTLLGSNVTLCCESSGSPRPNVEWFQAQKSSVSFPVFQEDGCLLIKMVKEDVDFICRAKNSFGLVETSTTVIAEILRGLEQSVILTNNIHYLRTLSFWLGSVVQSQSSYWKRCWRASVDGWASATFHSKCDNKGPTVTIIRVGKYIFGGYTSTSWDSNCGYLYSSKAFLFSLVNKPGWAPVKLSQTGQYSSYRYSIYSCSSYGPKFGGGSDIHISNYASSHTNSFTNLGHTYSAPSGHSYGSSFTKSFLAGSYKFQPDEVEVFYESTK